MHRPVGRVNEQFITLFQQKSRVAIDCNYLRALAIQQMEEWESISGVCSYKRHVRSQFNGDSFRTAHRPEALESSRMIDPRVQRRVFLSRSYQQSDGFERCCRFVHRVTDRLAHGTSTDS